MAAASGSQLGAVDLTKLIGKIETNLNGAGAKQTKSKKQKRSTESKGGGDGSRSMRSKPRLGDQARPAIIASPSAVSASTDQVKNASQPLLNGLTGEGKTRGKKRNASGEIKPLRSSDPVPPSDEVASAAGQLDKNEVLRREILALGGTEEDLDLVGDVDYDDEEAPQPSKKKKATPVNSLGNGFAKELAGFIGSLGLDAMDADVDEEDPVDEEIPFKAGKDNTAPVGSSSGDLGDTSSRELREVETSFASFPKGKNAGLKMQPRPDWHAAALPAIRTAAEKEASLAPQITSALHIHAKQLLETENQTYTTSHLSASSSNKFMSTIMSSGTLSDKVSALTLVAQESPLHTMKTLDSLLALAKKQSRAQAVYALGSLKDLLGQGSVLPADRRLFTFSKQPELERASTSMSTWRSGDKLPAGITDQHLIMWAFEDWLKGYYFQVLAILESWGSDQIEFARDRSLGYVFELLRDKPEQETNLLRLLVNKLGDPEKKIAAKASYFLLQLQMSHPLMRGTIVSAIESEVLFRPGQSAHAKYYCIITLNQTVLAREEEELANQLLGLYFTLFVALLTKPDLPAEKGSKHPKSKKPLKKTPASAQEAPEQDEQLVEKLFSAILTGVNRAFPFSATDDDTLEKHVDTLFKVTHSSNFNTSLQALILIQRLTDTRASIGARFYRTLYESLLDPRLLTSSKQALYLNLLYKSLDTDFNVARVKAFIKRLLQVTTLHQPSFVCGALFLVMQLQASSPALRDMCTNIEEPAENDVEQFHDVLEDGEAPRPGVQADHAAPHTAYDPRKRDPEYGNADHASLWEILPFLSHFHPSVSLIASRLLNNEALPPRPDLASHTVIAFLDKFIYRNPKSAASSAPTQRGVSLMQPLYNISSTQLLTANGAQAKAAQPLNSNEFLSKPQGAVKEDEVFFHSYFSKIRSDRDRKIKKREKRVEAKAADEGVDLEGEDDPMEEEEVWKAMVGSAPDIEDDGMDEDDEDEIGLEDLSDGDLSDGDVGMEDGGDDLDFREDEDDLISSGEEVDTLPQKDQKGGKQEIQLLGSVPVQAPKKGEKRGTQRKRLKQLPTFASADDYAEMLRDDADT